MKKRFQKSYDVKTFLNKKKSGGRFVYLTLTGSALKLIPGIIFIVIIAFVTFGIFSRICTVDKMAQWAVESTLNFSREKTEARNLNIKDMFCANASALIGFETEERMKMSTKTNEITPKIRIDEETVRSNGVEIKNETDFSTDVISILSDKPKVTLEKPKVLIVHTHGSESYTPSKEYSYKHTGNYRTQDTDFNMIRVGEELSRTLKQKGVEVIHDKTINDYPSYNDSYNKTESVIKKHLEKDKNIAYVFDIHRDAVGSDDNIVKFVSRIDGKATAQVMIVCGTDTNLENPAWRENLKLGVHIQNYFNENYPGFMRPLNLRKERFNMHLTTGSLLFEIGTNGNTLDEALNAAKILGNGLGDFLNI